MYLPRRSVMLSCVRLLKIVFVCCLTVYAAPFFFSAHTENTELIEHAYQVLGVGSGRIKKALFSPDDEIHEVLLGLIAAERQHIMIASYVITDRRIAEALIAAHKAHVKVEIVVCRSGAKDQWTKVQLLHEKGIQVYVYPIGFTRSIMHNKFAVFHKVFGRMLLVTGSYNLTRSASQVNQENLLFLDDVDLAQQYLKRFEELKQLSVPLAQLKKRA